MASLPFDSDAGMMASGLARRGGAGAYVRLLRPTDWVKNVVVLIALVTSGNLTEGAAVRDAFLAFLTFCLVSSGFYAINDVLDAEGDREHPLKRFRPVAAGVIRPGRAVAFGLTLIALSAGTSLLVGKLLMSVLLVYIVLQALYNARLKRMRMLDVTALALGFVLRAVAGAVAIQVQTSVWLAMCVFFLCLYLGFIKRLADLASAVRGTVEGQAGGLGERRWHSPAGYDSRPELYWLLGVSAAMTLTTYLMYALSPHAQRLFGAGALGFALLTPVVVITVYRFFLRADAGLSDRPLDALVEDRVILLCFMLFVGGILVSLYLPAMDDLLERMLIH